MLIGRRLRILWGKSQAMQAPPIRKDVVDLPPVPGLPECKGKKKIKSSHAHTMVVITVYVYLSCTFYIFPVAIPPPLFDPFNLRGDTGQASPSTSASRQLGGPPPPPPPPGGNHPPPPPPSSFPPGPPPFGFPPPPPPPGMYRSIVYNLHEQLLWFSDLFHMV